MGAQQPHHDAVPDLSDASPFAGAAVAVDEANTAPCANRRTPARGLGAAGDRALADPGLGAMLWRRMLDHPDDDAARLVYADWLDERGDERAARRLRVQCALVCGAPDAASIADAHADLPTAVALRGPDPSARHFVTEVVYRRGLPWRIEINTRRARPLRAWLSRLDAAAACGSTAESLVLQCGAEESSAVAAEIVRRIPGWWPHVRAIALHGFAVDAAVIRALAAVPRLERLAVVVGDDRPLCRGDLDAALGELVGLEALTLGARWWQLPGRSCSVWDGGALRRLGALRTLQLPRLALGAACALAPLVRLERLELHMLASMWGIESISALPLRSLTVVEAGDMLLGVLPAWGGLGSIAIGSTHPMSPTRVSAGGLESLARWPALAAATFHGSRAPGAYVAAAHAAPRLIRLRGSAPVGMDDARALAGLVGLRAFGCGWRAPMPSLARWSTPLAALSLHGGACARSAQRLFARGAPRAIRLVGGSARRLNADRLELLAAANPEQLILAGRWSLGVEPEQLGAALPRLRMLWVDSMAPSALLALREANPGLAVAERQARDGTARLLHPRLEDWAPIAGETPAVGGHDPVPDMCWAAANA